MNKTPEELFKERTKRIQDAVQLKIPDRVPFMTMFHFYPTNRLGVSCEEAMYDYDKLGMAHKKAILELELDSYVNPYPFLALGRLLETLHSKQIRWPGHGISPHQTFQFVEAEHIRQEEYDEFLFDPTGFVLRTILPRLYLGSPQEVKAYCRKLIDVVGKGGGFILDGGIGGPDEAEPENVRAMAEAAREWGVYE